MKVSYEIDQSHSPVWENQDWRYCFLMGGRGNGRSGTASRYAVSQLLSKDYTRGAIMRAVREDIRASCWGEIIDRINEQEIPEQFHITENDMFIERGQNSLRAHGFKSSSGSLTARLKSLAGYNFIWIEEGEEVGEQEFRVLDDSLRTTKGRIRIVITLNTPPKSHWIIKRFFNLESHPEAEGFYIPKLKPEIKDAIYIPGTFRENLVNLDGATVSRYLQYKHQKPDYYWHMIEGLCPEVVSGRIYSGWQEIPAVPHEAKLLGYGLDFGFDPDPAAVVAVYYHDGGYILDEKLYERELTNEQLALNLKLHPKAVVIADSAEPKSIAELQAHGINVFPSHKGPDSVNFGIKHMQGLRISYTANSKNLKEEYETLAWKLDKDGNNMGIEDPKCQNHLLSGARYFFAEMVQAKIVPRQPTQEEKAAAEFQEMLKRKKGITGERKRLFVK
jgi:phage terminase large subunit